MSVSVSVSVRRGDRGERALGTSADASCLRMPAHPRHGAAVAQWVDIRSRGAGHLFGPSRPLRNQPRVVSTRSGSGGTLAHRRAIGSSAARPRAALRRSFPPHSGYTLDTLRHTDTDTHADTLRHTLTDTDTHTHTQTHATRHTRHAAAGSPSEQRVHVAQGAARTALTRHHSVRNAVTQDACSGPLRPGRTQVVADHVPPGGVLFVHGGCFVCSGRVFCLFMAGVLFVHCGEARLRRSWLA